jgi:hypothetical protein
MSRLAAMMRKKYIQPLATQMLPMPGLLGIVGCSRVFRSRHTNDWKLISAKQVVIICNTYFDIQ